MLTHRYKRLVAELLPEPVTAGFGGSALIGGEPAEVVVFMGEQDVKIST